jgi:hypothetical protein
MELLFKLVVGHYLCDFPLQGDFCAKAKNRINPIPGVPWYHCMTAHCMIQAGMVYFLTRSWLLTGMEFVVHFLLDYAKSEGKIDFEQDQVNHICCKLIYVGLIQLFGRHLF